MISDTLLAALIFGAALLYSSVGHGGASGYLAVMALAGIVPAVMKPAALMLNIMVSGIAAFRFYRAGAFSFKLFFIFAAASAPAAFLGGMAVLPGTVYKKIVGAVLLAAAVQLFRTARAATPPAPRAAPASAALAVGGIIGLLSGLTGVGGGIFLSPILLLTGWTDPRRCAGISAAFILTNSAAGLAGYFSGGDALPSAPLALWGTAAVSGGLLGSWYGAKRLSNTALRRLLAAVLTVAALKFLLA